MLSENTYQVAEKHEISRELLDRVKEKCIVFKEHEDGFILVAERKEDYYFLVKCKHDKYTLGFIKEVIKTIKNRKVELTSHIDDNHQEMFKAVNKTGGKILENDVVVWEKPNV